MDERLAAADAASKAGRGAEAIDLLIALIKDNPAQPVSAYRDLLLQLYRTGRLADGETWSAVAVEQHPRESELWNMRGVLLRLLRRLPDAISCLERAVELDPGQVSPLNNLGN